MTPELSITTERIDDASPMYQKWGRIAQLVPIFGAFQIQVERWPASCNGKGLGVCSKWVGRTDKKFDFSEKSNF